MPNGKNENRGGRGGYESGERGSSTREREENPSGGRNDSLPRRRNTVGAESGGRREGSYGYFGGRLSVVAPPPPSLTTNRGARLDFTDDDLEEDLVDRGRIPRLSRVTTDLYRENAKPRASRVFEFDIEVVKSKPSRANRFDTESERGRDSVRSGRDYNQEGTGRQTFTKDEVVRPKSPRVNKLDSESDRARDDARFEREQIDEGATRQAAMKDRGLYDYGGRQSVAIGASPFGAGMRGSRAAGKVEFSQQDLDVPITGERIQNPTTRNELRRNEQHTWSNRKSPSQDGDIYDYGGRQSVVVGGSQWGAGVRSGRKSMAGVETGSASDSHKSVGGADTRRTDEDSGARHSSAMGVSRWASRKVGGREGSMSLKGQRDARHSSVAPGGARKYYDARRRDSLGAPIAGSGGSQTKKAMTNEFYDFSGTQRVSPDLHTKRWGLYSRRSKAQGWESPRSQAYSGLAERGGERSPKSETVATTGQQRGSAKRESGRRSRGLERSSNDFSTRDLSSFMGRVPPANQQRIKQSTSGKAQSVRPSSDISENQSSEGSGATI